MPSPSSYNQKRAESWFARNSILMVEIVGRIVGEYSAATWQTKTDAVCPSLLTSGAKGDLKATVDLSFQERSTRVTPGRMIELSVSCRSDGKA